MIRSSNYLRPTVHHQNLSKIVNPLHDPFQGYNFLRLYSSFFQSEQIMYNSKSKSKDIELKYGNNAISVPWFTLNQWTLVYLTMSHGPRDNSIFEHHLITWPIVHSFYSSCLSASGVSYIMKNAMGRFH